MSRASEAIVASMPAERSRRSDSARTTKRVAAAGMTRPPTPSPGTSDPPPKAHERGPTPACVKARTLTRATVTLMRVPERTRARSPGTVPARRATDRLSANTPRPASTAAVALRSTAEALAERTRSAVARRSLAALSSRPELAAARATTDACRSASPCPGPSSAEGSATMALRVAAAWLRVSAVDTSSSDARDTTPSKRLIAFAAAEDSRRKPVQSSMTAAGAIAARSW
mmetsp:Transcript_14669/g.43035  ORF Transcript_14669/g.43035 Transcript_14669/m.43035 type:complete len:229 (+) Transcript_14669:2348-3034(+)